jgi:hypothetical protein
MFEKFITMSYNQLIPKTGNCQRPRRLAGNWWGLTFSARGGQQ